MVFTFFRVLKKLANLDKPLVRDFTPEMEAAMVQEAKSVVEDDDDLFSKYVTDPFGRWLDKNGALDVLYGVSNYRKNVIDFYNYSAVNIEEICRQMRKYDSRTGQTISGYVDQADRVCRLTKALAECLDVDSKEYVPQQPVSSRLEWFSNAWIKDMQGQNVQIRDVFSAAEVCRRRFAGHKLTAAEIEAFCRDQSSPTLFRDYNKVIFEEEMDWNALEITFLAGGTILYKGVEMTVDEFLEQGYGTKMARQTLNELISSVISAEDGAQALLKDHDEAKKIFEKHMKDYLKDKDEESDFKSFVEAAGGIEFVKELGESCPELLDYLFTDYTEGREILENIERTCDRSGSEEMRAAVESLRLEYDSKWTGLMSKTKDFSVDMVERLTQESVDDWIEKNIGDASVLTKLLEIGGLEDKVDGAHQLVALRKISGELQKGYEDAIEKINSGDYTQEDMTYAENMFRMMKENSKAIYSTYRDMCDDPGKQIWCNEQIDKINSAEMSLGVYQEELGQSGTL